MGVGISLPPLVKQISLDGAGKVTGTVTGVAAHLIMFHILQSGDVGGHYRRALKHFTFPKIAQQVVDAYFIEGGVRPGMAGKPVPMVTLNPSRLVIALIICANFAFVWLAKEGHSYPVSINWLEKVQTPHLYAIYGAMLAKVDCITMGAGIPLQIPKVLDAYMNNEVAGYHVTVTGSGSGTEIMRFNPSEFFGQDLPDLKRPQFIPIVSSNVLAEMLVKRLAGKIDGVAIELEPAGGHNAPPREIFFQRLADFLRKYNIPWWVAGGYASPQGLERAKAMGAQGIQVGSIMALCTLSGMDPLLRYEIIRLWHRGELQVITDPDASPTGYRIKLVKLAGTLSDEAVYQNHLRCCDQHGLVTPHQLPSGKIVFCCPAEPNGTDKTRCLCNGLMRTARLGDLQQPAFVTLGSDLSFLQYLTSEDHYDYTVKQAINHLLSAA
jgi:NAD(P)H-dependent flavin oxidoreductase YrpB (nitropropane dioxygenase family)